MNIQRRFVPMLASTLLVVLAGCASTPDLAAPSVRVFDQPVTFDTVIVNRVVSTADGWIVIQAQADGRPGPVIGYAAVPAGLSRRVKVKVDGPRLTAVLYAELLADSGVRGKLEYPGADTAVTQPQPIKWIPPEANVESSSGGGGMY